MTDPTEEQIAKVLAKRSDPRALAIAYLRSVQRETDAKKALKVSEAARDQLRKATNLDHSIDDALEALFGKGRK